MTKPFPLAFRRASAAVGLVVEPLHEPSERGRRGVVGNGREGGREDASVRPAIAQRDALAARRDAVAVRGRIFSTRPRRRSRHRS